MKLACGMVTPASVRLGAARLRGQRAMTEPLARSSRPVSDVARWLGPRRQLRWRGIVTAAAGGLLYMNAACGTVPTAGCANPPCETKREESCSRLTCDTGRETALEFGRAYLTSQAARRQALEASLLVQDNTYAEERLENYALDGGWDQLPIHNVPVAAVVINEQGVLATGQHSLLSPPPGNPQEWQLDSWIEFGRRAFELYPSQRHSELELQFQLGERLNDARANQYGLWRDARQHIGGLISVQYNDGSQGLALSCATCHARPNASGALRWGAPSDIDLTALSPTLRWGAGKVDVTPDGIDNPVAIADLRATRGQSRLHYSGNLRNSLPSLVVRVETLLITSSNNVVRPPREVAFALALYIWSLGENEMERAQGLHAPAVQALPGRALFDAHCQDCHMDTWGTGEWVALDAVGTDPLVATSPARGSGGYRVPSLLGLWERRLSHEARSDGLVGWMWPVPDNEFGHRPHPPASDPDAWSESDRAALLEVLSAAFPPH